jgi:DNA-binding transcriptional ArsR family regulator
MVVIPNLDICDEPEVSLARVQRVQESLTDSETMALLAEIFAALADPTRLRIIEALAIEPMCVCDLSEALGLSQSGISHHLRTLRTLRLVKHRRVGRRVFYALDDEHIRRLFAQGLEHVREDHLL